MRKKEGREERKTFITNRYITLACKMPKFPTGSKHTDEEKVFELRLTSVT